MYRSVLFVVIVRLFMCLHNCYLHNTLLHKNVCISTKNNLMICMMPQHFAIKLYILKCLSNTVTEHLTVLFYYL